MVKTNCVKVWRMTDMYDAELLKGNYTSHAYPWHSHEEFSLGLVTRGTIDLSTRTTQGSAKAGSVVVINSEQVHRGASTSEEGWCCRTIHVHPNVFHTIAAGAGKNRYCGNVTFRGPVIEDPLLAQQMLELHLCSEDEASSLERQSRIVNLITSLLERHAETSASFESRPNEQRSVDKARAYLDENLSNKVTLEALSAEADLTPFRLLRAFQHALGLTPHAYQTQARVRLAHTLIRARASLADVAAATGFADQAHLTRVFRSIMGGTPGQFRAATALSG